MKNKNFSYYSSPQFLDLQPSDVSSHIFKCTVKVMYTEGNRNGTYISKEQAEKLGARLRGAQVVGYFKKENNDFSDHGIVITIDNDGITEEKRTIPIGFVPTDAKVWFQDFVETNDFGEEITRTYLLTECYIWDNIEGTDTIKEKPKNQSMEIEISDAHWAMNEEGIEFYVIDDAEITALCILGDNVEPCFEGANINKNESTSYSLESNYVNTLKSMMNELQTILKGGEKKLDKEKDNYSNNPQDVEEVVETETEKVEVETETPTDEAKEVVETETEEFEVETGAAEVETETEDEVVVEEEEPTETETEDFKAKYELTLEENEKLKNELEELKTSYNELKEFKLNVEREQKLEVVNNFTVLTDEEKKDIVENIDSYSLDDVKSKLSIAYAEKSNLFAKVAEEKENDEKTTFTFSLTDTKSEQVDELAEILKEFKSE